MTDRDVHLPVAAQPGVGTLSDLARAAETAGYGRVWLPETWGRDATAVLAALAERTETVGLGASVLNVYSRSPALVGQAAATLGELSGGRFRLGLGPSGPALIEGWHGVPFECPLRRTREYVEIVRRVLSGEAVDYRGEVFDLAGFRLRCEPPEPPPAVDAAGMGPKAVELAGRFADGWHALVLTPDGLRDRMGDLRRGADLGGRDPDDLRVTLSVTCCGLPDGGRARELARSHLAFYLGAMGTYYRDSLARQGYGEVAHEVASAWASGDRDRARTAIDGDLLDRLCAAGTPDRARRELSKFEAVEGVDAVAVGFPRGATPDEIRATLEALAPEG